MNMDFTSLVSKHSLTVGTVTWISILGDDNTDIFIYILPE